MSTIVNIIGTIPVKRKKYVISKYIVGIISMLTTIIVVIIIYNLIDIDITLDLLLTTSILSSAIIPLIMKFGIVKVRLMMFAVTFFVIFYSMSLVDILQEPPRFLEATIYYINKTNPLIISSIVSILAILISVLICIKMYDKKEFK